MRNAFYIHAKTKHEDHLCEALLVRGGFAILSIMRRGRRSRETLLFIYLSRGEAIN